MDYIRIKTTRLQDNKTTSRDVTPVASEKVAESQSRDVTPVASEKVTESQSRDVTPVASEKVAEPVEVPVAHSSQFTTEDIKNLLKDWIKLYPNSFAPDVEFKIYQLADGDVIIQLHEDLSSMAVSLLVLYFETTRLQDYKTTSRDVTPVASQNITPVASQNVTPVASQNVTESPSRQGLVTEPVEVLTANNQQSIAYITIDDTEVLLKQNEGKRAMVLCSQQDNKTTRLQDYKTTSRDVTPVASENVTPVASENKILDVASVRFVLEDNYVLDYNFEKRPQPVKDCDMVFEEPEFSLPEEYESVRVGDVVKKKIDEILDEGLTPKKMLMYLLCGGIGLGIGFLIVYLMSK